jgi:hypothetical protein
LATWARPRSNTFGTLLLYYYIPSCLGRKGVKRVKRVKMEKIGFRGKGLAKGRLKTDQTAGRGVGRWRISHA